MNNQVKFYLTMLLMGFSILILGVALAFSNFGGAIVGLFGFIVSILFMRDTIDGD